MDRAYADLDPMSEIYSTGTGVGTGVGVGVGVTDGETDSNGVGLLPGDGLLIGVAVGWDWKIMALSAFVGSAAVCALAFVFAIVFVPVWLFVPICALPIELLLEPVSPGVAPPVIPPA
jgi:hypothetical protein